MNSIKNVGDGLHRAADEERQQQRSPSLQAPNRAGTDPEKTFFPPSPTRTRRHRWRDKLEQGILNGEVSLYH